MTPMVSNGMATVGAAEAPKTGTSVTKPDARAMSGKRLAGIDGLRAVAALWVVLFHIHAFSGVQFAHARWLDLFLRSGSTGVSLFLVLSGFCLYLPFAGGRTERFKVGQFFLRRCRRLMPAYYTSLVFAVAINLLAASRLGFPHMTAHQAAWQILTHVTLTHTLFPSTFYALNGAYWSLGLEWQLYLALPLLIWGIHRFGLRRTAFAAVLCNVVYRLGLALTMHHGIIGSDGILASAVLPNLLPGRWAEFVFGMVAAELYVTGHVDRWANKLALLIPVLVPVSLVATRLPLSHVLFGCVFFGLVSAVLASGNVISRIFSWRPLVALGTMSYSLYLVHQPVIQGLAFLIQTRGHASPTETFLVLLALLPFVVLLAWLLFVTVERRTLNTTHAGATPALAPSTMHKPWLWYPWDVVRAIIGKVA